MHFTDLSLKLFQVMNGCHVHPSGPLFIVERKTRKKINESELVIEPTDRFCSKE